jgi:hypothetical protein
MRNETYVGQANLFGIRFVWQRSIPLRALNQHELGRYGLKGAVRFGPLMLVYLDLDVHKLGSLEACRRLAAIIRRDFPGVPEFQFNERGAFSWLILNAEGLVGPDGEQEYNRLLNRLQEHYATRAKSLGLDVEKVEVLGRVYEHTWQEGSYGFLQCVKGGDLIKVPSSVDVFRQPPVDVFYLNDRKFDPVELTVVQKVESERRRSSGSFRPRLVSEEMEDGIGRLVAWVDQQFPDRPTRVGNWALSARAFAEILLTMCLLKPNADGSNPGDRHAAFIRALWEEGVFEFSWNHPRHRAVREYLSEQGWVQWQDERHSEGQACKWKLVQALVEAVEAVCGASEAHEKKKNPLPPDLDLHLAFPAVFALPTLSDRGPAAYGTPRRLYSVIEYPPGYFGGPPHGPLAGFQLAA